MTRRLQAGLVSMLLFIGISCTKENDNSLPSGSSRSVTASSAEESVAADDLAPISFVGSWVLYWSWGCGTRYTVSFVINSDGTFSDAFGETGQWTQNKAQNLILFHFDGRTDYWSGRATKAGCINGIMADFPYYTGCFTLTSSSSDEKIQEDNIKGGTRPTAQ